jgi:hypothetical protein
MSWITSTTSRLDASQYRSIPIRQNAILEALETCAAARQPSADGVPEKVTVRMTIWCSHVVSILPRALGILSLSGRGTMAPEQRFTAAYPRHWSEARTTQPPSWEPHRRAAQTLSERCRRRIAPEWRLKKEGAAGDGRRSKGRWHCGALWTCAAERQTRQTAAK